MPKTGCNKTGRNTQSNRSRQKPTILDNRPWAASLLKQQENQHLLRAAKPAEVCLWHFGEIWFWIRFEIWNLWCEKSGEILEWDFSICQESTGNFGEISGQISKQISGKFSETSFQISGLFSETSFSRRAVLTLAEASLKPHFFTSHFVASWNLLC